MSEQVQGNGPLQLLTFEGGYRRETPFSLIFRELAEWLDEHPNSDVRAVNVNEDEARQWIIVLVEVGPDATRAGQERTEATQRPQERREGPNPRTRANDA